MEMGECQIAGTIDAQVRILSHGLTQLADTSAGIQNNRTFWAFQQNTAGIAAKFLKSLTANRN
jgi:hypothetical protein